MTRIRLLPLALLVAAPAFAADGFDVSTQIGPDPVLPAPEMSLLPDLTVAEVVGWQEGETRPCPRA